MFNSIHKFYFVSCLIFLFKQMSDILAQIDFTNVQTPLVDVYRPSASTPYDNYFGAHAATPSSYYGHDTSRQLTDDDFGTVAMSDPLYDGHGSGTQTSQQAQP